MDIGIRLLWLFVGLTSLALGALGIVVPLLPTTPFLLLAAFAFARSSARMTTWLHEHRRFGPLIANWHKYGSIDRSAKIVSMVVIVLAPILTFAIGVPTWALITQVIVLVCSAAFILTRPLPPH
ncbi:MAG: YbaN family protein [Gammaproteobacteria bacterium]|nr:YbaN family protein [Gammaproteobacteria bacterium]